MFSQLLDRLTTDPNEMDTRLKSRLTPWELLALGLSFSFVGLFIWAQSRLQIPPYDYDIYIHTQEYDFYGFYYPHWTVPVFWLLNKLQHPYGYILLNAVSILSVFFALRIFGGNVPMALLSFQMLYVLFLGQIVGVLLGGLGLLWWGISHKRWYIAGLGLILAWTKYQIGIPACILLLLLAEISWKHWLRLLFIPLLVVGGSLILSPSWPLKLWETLQKYPVNDWGSISLWRWIGPYALLLWLPPLLLPLTRRTRFIALIATNAMALPYFQQTDILSLFILPIGWPFVLLGNLGYLFFLYYWKALQALVIIPLLIYLTILTPPFFTTCQKGIKSLLKAIHPPKAW
ncbi:MAG: hypothetical protein AB1345_14695, partial [Chloroflexota bacterium]